MGHFQPRLEFEIGHRQTVADFPQFPKILGKSRVINTFVSENDPFSVDNTESELGKFRAKSGQRWDFREILYNPPFSVNAPFLVYNRE